MRNTEAPLEFHVHVWSIQTEMQKLHLVNLTDYHRLDQFDGVDLRTSRGSSRRGEGPGGVRGAEAGLDGGRWAQVGAARCYGTSQDCVQRSMPIEIDSGDRRQDKR
jgi:hypothetical protein